MNAPVLTAPRVGRASATIHHGEILQGAFDTGDDRPCRGLVTLPCDLYVAQSMFTPTTTPSVVVSPPTRTKARRAAEQTLAVLGWPAAGGRLDLLSDVPPSRGFGSSTSDVLAAIRAVQAAFGHDLPDTLVAQIAVQSETASDALMFGPRTVLFAHREGRVIEDFQRPLPKLAVLGFGTSREGRGIDTLSLPPATYRPSEIAEFHGLREQLRQALRTSEARLVGAVATASTAINQRHLPMERYDLVASLVGRTGAAGLQTAHSGDIAGLIFDGADPEHPTQRSRARRLLRELGITQTWTFTVGMP